MSRKAASSRELFSTVKRFFLNTKLMGLMLWIENSWVYCWNQHTFNAFARHKTEPLFDYENSCSLIITLKKTNRLIAVVGICTMPLYVQRLYVPGCLFQAFKRVLKGSHPEHLCAWVIIAITVHNFLHKVHFNNHFSGDAELDNKESVIYCNTADMSVWKSVAAKSGLKRANRRSCGLWWTSTLHSGGEILLKSDANQGN